MGFRKHFMTKVSPTRNGSKVKRLSKEMPVGLPGKRQPLLHPLAAAPREARTV